MSFMYPRVVTFHRPGAQSGVGAQQYGGATQASETLVLSGIRCSIQERREGTNNTVGLPGDAQRPTYYVFIKKSVVAFGTIRERDVMIDELGTRYNVLAPYWDSLGYRLTVGALES